MLKTIQLNKVFFKDYSFKFNGIIPLPEGNYKFIFSE